MTKSEAEALTHSSLVFSHSGFFRHSTFGIRHSPAGKRIYNLHNPGGT
jgi:hypothetical protein